MSHIVEVALNVDVTKHHDCLRKACGRIEGAEYLGLGEHTVFSNKVYGYAASLPGWNYPVVAKADGQLAYDNYKGRWGDAKQLDKLKQAYGVEVAKKAARKQGKAVTERAMKDGSIRLEVSVG